MPTAYRSLYLTFPDATCAARIARALVDARLVACVNVLPGIRSIYRWQDDVQDEDEVAAVAKTRADLVPAVVRAVRRLHPYDTPCVVAWPIEAGDAAYLAWIGASTVERA